MKKIIVAIIILIGLGILGYPTLSNYLTEMNGSYALDHYAREVDSLDAAQIAAAWAEAEKYNESLTGVPVHDPFLEGTGMAMPDDYTQVLNIGGIMAHLEIPKISVSLPVYHGTSDSVLQNGVGHLEGSTLPIGGESRHSVLTGHTGLVHAKLFTDLVELTEGDLFYITVLGEILAYQVDQIKVVDPGDSSDLLRYEGEDYVTLLTCTPYGINSHRLLVRGVRVEYIPEVKDSITPVTSSTNTMVLYAAAVTSAVMLLAIGVTAVFTIRRRKSVPKRAIV